MFYVCSRRSAEGDRRMPGSAAHTAVRANWACSRSVELARAAHAPVRGGAAPCDSPARSRRSRRRSAPRPKMMLQTLEKIKSAPGDAMTPQASDPQYLAPVAPLRSTRSRGSRVRRCFKAEQTDGRSTILIQRRPLPGLEGRSLAIGTPHESGFTGSSRHEGAAARRLAWELRVGWK